jgi:hypothetical protein
LLPRLLTWSLLLLALGVIGCTGSVTPTASPGPSAPPTQASIGVPAATATATAPPATSVPATPTSVPTKSVPTITPSRPADSSPTPSSYPDGSVIVTFKVINEKYRILVTSPDNIAIVEALLVGDPAPSIPNGLVVRGDTSVNKGWSWHIDPDSLEFADVTTEVCDGKPSYVEQDIITSDYFCPWSAQVVAVVPANR